MKHVTTTHDLPLKPLVTMDEEPYNVLGNRTGERKRFRFAATLNVPFCKRGNGSFTNFNILI